MGFPPTHNKAHKCIKSFSSTCFYKLPLMGLFCSCQSRYKTRTRRARTCSRVLSRTATMVFSGVLVSLRLPLVGQTETPIAHATGWADLCSAYSAHHLDWRFVTLQVSIERTFSSCWHGRSCFKNIPVTSRLTDGAALSQKRIWISRLFTALETTESNINRTRAVSVELPRLLSYLKNGRCVF